MDREAILLERLHSRLQGWVSFIKRSTHASDVVFFSVPSDGFKCVVRWVHPRGSGEYALHFSKQYVLGSGAPLGPCDYAKQVVRGVLVQRGIWKG